MQPSPFPGSVPLDAPVDSQEGEFLPQFIKPEYDKKGNPVVTTGWKPSYEDLQALNRGELIYITHLGKEFPPFTVYTLDENGYSNDAGLKDDEYEQ